MIISCQCLNVTVNAKGSDIQAVELPQLGLSGSELADPFFTESICTVEIVRITKLQGSLVQVRNVGNWIIHQCLNCSINTHAIHRERGAAYVLISRAMLTNPADIIALKASDKYSAVFRIVVNHSRPATQALAKFTVSQLDGPVQSAMAAIQQQLAEAIQQEVARVEEEVRAFSEQKYAALEEFRENAHKDFRALTNILFEAKDSLSSTPKPTFIDGAKARPVASGEENIPPAVISSSVPHFPIKISAHLQSSPVPSFGNVISGSQRQIGGEPLIPYNKMMKTNSSKPISNDGGDVRADKTERKVKTRLFNQSLPDNKKEGSLDAEGLFDLEGMDETPAEVFHSEGEGESDTDDSGSHDEGIHIPRSRSAQFALAKSLPMNVPAFLSASVHQGGHEDDDRHPQDPMDIAASIKALARSVHGDANVFGELPRPRFSTQI